MNRIFRSIFFLAAAVCAPQAAADLLVIPQSPAPPSVDYPIPSKGSSMEAVRSQFGEPSDKLGPVGGASKYQPPITHWIYDNRFHVVFEHQHVVDVVIPDQPAPVYNTEELAPTQPGQPIP